MGKYEFKINPISADYSAGAGNNLEDTTGATSAGLYSAVKPGCPVALSGVWTAGTKKVKVKWNAPPESGGAPIKKYEVFKSPVPAAAVNSGGEATSDASREVDVGVTWEDGQQYFRVNAFSTHSPDL